MNRSYLGKTIRDGLAACGINNEELAKQLESEVKEDEDAAEEKIKTVRSQARDRALARVLDPDYFLAKLAANLKKKKSGASPKDNDSHPAKAGKRQLRTSESESSINQDEPPVETLFGHGDDTAKAATVAPKFVNPIKKFKHEFVEDAVE